MAYARFDVEFDSAKFLGKGGYGAVVKARNKFDGQYYAIKRVKLPNRQAGHDKKLKEPVALAQLVHPNIVRYYSTWKETPAAADISSFPATDTDSSAVSTTESGSFITFEKGSPPPGIYLDSGIEGASNQDCTTTESSISEEENIKSVKPCTYLYIQMELCKTETLADWLLANQDRQQTTCFDIIRQIATGLQHVHKSGFIHRDLSPKNIFFSVDNVVKIGDFGLVTSISDESEETTTKAVGTELYRSREQLDGRKYDSKTDIFALGIIMFELLYPMGTDTERITVLPDVKKGQFPKGFNETMADLVRRLVDSDPEKRPDATQVLSFLGTYTLDAAMKNPILHYK